MIRALILACILSCSSLPCFCQTATGPAKATASCSTANTGNNNTFRITCTGDQKDAQKMLVILNKILANQLDPDAVMAKLDEILKARNFPVDITQNGGGNIAQVGDNNSATILRPIPFRSLTEDQKQRIAAFLQTLPPTVMVSVGGVYGSGDAVNYAGDFFPLFEGRHLDNQTTPAIRTGFPITWTDVIVATRTDEDSAAPYRNAFVNALIGSGIQAKRANGSNVPSGDIEFLVGFRPEEVKQSASSSNTGGQESTAGSTQGVAAGSATQGPGSIAQIGGTGNQATIINGPPPLPTPTVKVCATYDPIKTQTTILVTTSSQIPRPFFAFFFDGPVSEGKAEMSAGFFGYDHGRAERMPNPENSFWVRINTINLATTMWFPSDGAIKVTVPSNAPVRLIRVLGGAGDDPDAVFQENIILTCS